MSDKSTDDVDDDKCVNDDVQADLRVYSVLSPGSPERKTGGRGFPDTTISCLEDDQYDDRLIVLWSITIVDHGKTHLACPSGLVA